MRDLASRLRDIVRRHPPEARRELTYVPDMAVGFATVAEAAAQLGGDVRTAADGSAFVTVDRVWDALHWHGRRQVSSCALDAAAPIALYDPRLGPGLGPGLGPRLGPRLDPRLGPRLGAPGDWASRVVFFDIETTGLSGGAGMIAFLVGCGWYEDDGFRVRQFLLTGPAGEAAMLDALADIFNKASLLVTFNGRTFDVPVMDMRWAFHRKATPTDDLPHFDMLPPARRLWGGTGVSRRDGSVDPLDNRPLDNRSCSLTSLERSILGFHRIGDVPGMEIPARYFQFLRTGDATAVEGVLEHNRLDLLSLAAITAYALRLASDGPESCREAGEQLALGRLHERAGNAEQAMRAYELAAASREPDARTDALARLAVLLRREARYEESAAAWQRVLDLGSRRGRGLSMFERRAAEALAIHHEHRAGDLSEAKRFAEAMRANATGKSVGEIDHRIGRLDRKILKTTESTKGGPEAAPLLRD